MNCSIDSIRVSPFKACQHHACPSYLGDQEADRQILLHCLLNGALSCQNDALACIDREQHAISQPEGGGQLVVEVDMAWAVNDVDQEALSSGGL